MLSPTNLVAAALLAFTILFYVVVYTAWLKRRTPQNIVIGGAAGALPPVIGWAAATGDIGLEPLVLFLIIFLWTPPHFWALALNRSDEYARAGVPMLPVVAGRAATTRQILLYSASPGPGFACCPGCSDLPVRSMARSPPSAERFFVAARVAAEQKQREPIGAAAQRLFVFSIAYLFAAVCRPPDRSRPIARCSRPACAAPSDRCMPICHAQVAPLRHRHGRRGLTCGYGLLAALLIGAAALGGCSEGVLDPKGPIAAAERQILFNSLGIMLAIVIPTILATLGVAFWFRVVQPARALPARFRVFRPARDAGLVDPGHDGAAGRRRRLGRRARPRSAQADCLDGQACQGSGRLARLEMAVHLPRPGHRQRQPVDRPCRRRRSASS